MSMITQETRNSQIIFIHVQSLLAKPEKAVSGPDNEYYI